MKWDVWGSIYLKYSEGRFKLERDWFLKPTLRGFENLANSKYIVLNSVTTLEARQITKTTENIVLNQITLLFLWVEL